MNRHLSITSTGLLLLGLLLMLAACNRQPTDIFLPIVIGEATAEATILDTPAATPTDLPVTRTVVPLTTPVSTVVSLFTPSAPTGTFVAPPGGGMPGIIIRTPRAVGTHSTPRAAGTRSAIGIILPTPGPPQPTPMPTAIPSMTPTTVFRNYLALIVSQLQQSRPPTDTPIPTTPVPAPIVVTLSPPPISTATLTPTATSGTPTATATPFTGNVRLLPRDPVTVAGVIPVVAYADPDNVLGKDWSNFYAPFTTNSDFVRIYASEESRIFGPALALTSTDQWAEGVCMVPSSFVGVQFWGDENDGWARVLVDGTERWRGNTYGQSPQLFVRFLEISNLAAAPHVVRIEPLGQPGINTPNGNIHVSIYAVVCGLPVESEIFVPILQR